jgi:hypothetical protein
MSKDKEPDFVIIQQKYATKGAHINEKYSFLLQKGYSISSVHRNVNPFEEHFLGWDGFALLQRE